ncbi:hypothetical protein ABIE27_004361 [Paenibacillus sp. 4624]|uniref:tail fiber protein n=1 Tax=Paenibacillus sp. 4624 TaxID=3156453 RepID=UPI003D1ECDB7
MPQETDRLKLPLPLGNETVSRESINAIFEKIDAGVATQADLDALREAVSKMDIPDASLTQKGKVQLSNKMDGTSETVAATEKAVRDAKVAAETSAKNASLPKSGGSLVGDAGVLNLVGSTHVYQGFLPAGTNAGRKGYIGFGTPGGIDFSIANEYGGELIFRDKNGTTTLSDLKSSVSSGKASIAAAITGKGIPTAADASFLMMSNNISSLRTSIKFKSATVSASGGSISSLSFKPLFLLVQSSSYREVGGMIGSVRSNGNILAWLDESNTLKRSAFVGAIAGTSSPESSNFDFSYVEFGERSVNFGVQYYARSNQNSLECFVFGL